MGLSMARVMMKKASRVEDRDPQKSVVKLIDDEIAALLATIEKEKVPQRLQDLVLKLQSALSRKRAEAGGL
jgi:hypothetical protein